MLHICIEGASSFRKFEKNELSHKPDGEPLINKNSLNYLRVMPLGCKDIGIISSEVSGEYSITLIAIN